MQILRKKMLKYVAIYSSWRMQITSNRKYVLFTTSISYTIIHLRLNVAIVIFGISMV